MGISGKKIIFADLGMVIAKYCTKNWITLVKTSKLITNLYG